MTDNGDAVKTPFYVGQPVDEVLYIANYGHDHYQRWYEDEFGLPWENREMWERLSPFNKVTEITTPHARAREMVSSFGPGSRR